jgi:hypothetical protein
MESVCVKYLLDTHAAIWAAEEEPKLGQRAKLALLASAAGDALISDITLLEISMLVKNVFCTKSLSHAARRCSGRGQDVVLHRLVRLRWILYWYPEIDA